jgi:hypothetical protein
VTSWTSPPTFAAGDTLTASQLNTYLRDNPLYLYELIQALNSSGCQASKSSQTIPDSSGTLASLNVEVADFGGWFPGSGTTITVPAAALPTGVTTITVDVVCSVVWDSNATGMRRARFKKNGSTAGGSSVRAVSGQTTDQTASILIPSLTTGDTLTLELYQDSGGNLDAAIVFSVFRKAWV